MENERFAIIGAGHFGSAIATALSEKGAEVLVIDSDINVVQNIAEDVAYAVCIDIDPCSVLNTKRHNAQKALRIGAATVSGQIDCALET